MAIDKEKFVSLKLKPSLLNVENAVGLFSGIGLNQKSLAELRKEVDAASAAFTEDGKASEVDEALLGRLTNISRELGSLASVVQGNEQKSDTTIGLKAYGEKFGARYGLYMAPEGKLLAGVFSGLGQKLSERLPKVSAKNWTYLLRGLYIAGFATGFLPWTYLILYWVMVASPSVDESGESLDLSALNSSLGVEVAGAIESALVQDGSFQARIDALEASLKKIASLFDTEGLAKAKSVAAFITAWPNGGEHVSEIFYDSAVKMAEYLEKYSLSDDLEALEFARAELKPIENKLGYAYLVAAAAVVDQEDRMRATYNNEVDLGEAKYVQEFRQAHEAGDYYLAAYYYGVDSVATKQKQIQEHNEQVEAERKAAEERAAAEAAAKAAAAAQAPPREAGGGFLSTVGKAAVAGAALSKANDSGMVQATCRKCNHFEQRPKPKGASYKTKCPRCGSFGFNWGKA